jgi:hypothetical protein
MNFALEAHKGGWETADKAKDFLKFHATNYTYRDEYVNPF